MKKKMSVSLLAAIVAILTLTGAALAVGLNLFELFGREDERLLRIAPQAGVRENNLTTVETAELGETVAQFDGAYYDGQGLIATFTIQNDSRCERFEPTTEMLASMEKLDGEGLEFFREATDEYNRDEELRRSLVEAVNRGEPVGYVHYSVYFSDHTVTDDGIDLPAESERCEEMEEGKLCFLREYETPLPEAVRNRDVLELRIPLYRSASYCWFDGNDYYLMTEREQAGEITATAKRADAVTRVFAGEGTVDGKAAKAEARVSAIHATLEVKCEGLPEDPTALVADEAMDDVWYDFLLQDENGVLLARNSQYCEDGWIQLEFDGAGYLPDALVLTVRIEGEGQWDAESHVLGEIAFSPVEG